MQRRRHGVWRPGAVCPVHGPFPEPSLCPDGMAVPSGVFSRETAGGLRGYGSVRGFFPPVWKWEGRDFAVQCGLRPFVSGMAFFPVPVGVGGVQILKPFRVI